MLQKPWIATIVVACLFDPSHASEGTVLPDVYRSSFTPLSYSYATDGGGRGTGFSLDTPQGELRVVPVYRQVTTQDPASLEFTLVPTGQRMTATWTPSRLQPEIVTFDMDWTGYGVLSVTANTTTRSIVSDRSTVSSCEALAGSPLHLAILDGYTRVRGDVEAHGSTPAPVHEGFLVAWLEGIALLERTVRACQNDMNIGGCSWRATDWSSCVKCCEDNNPEWGGVVVQMLCGAAVKKFCTGFVWCAAGQMGCGVIGTSLEQDRCIDKSCEGKPGDPGCEAPKPRCEGRCQAICYSGQDAECGECPEGRVCCN